MENLIASCALNNFLFTAPCTLFTLIFVIDGFLREVRPTNLKTRMCAFAMYACLTVDYAAEGRTPDRNLLVVWFNLFHAAARNSLILYFCELFAPIYLNLPEVARSAYHDKLVKVFSLYPYFRAYFLLHALMFSIIFTVMPTQATIAASISINVTSYTSALLPTSLLMLTVAYKIGGHRRSVESSHMLGSKSKSTKLVEIEMVIFAIGGIAIVFVGIMGDIPKIISFVSEPSVPFQRICSDGVALVLLRNILAVVGIFMIRAKSSKWRKWTPCYKKSSTTSSRKSSHNVELGGVAGDGSRRPSSSVQTRRRGKTYSVSTKSTAHSSAESVGSPRPRHASLNSPRVKSDKLSPNEQAQPTPHSPRRVRTYAHTATSSSAGGAPRRSFAFNVVDTRKEAAPGALAPPGALASPGALANASPRRLTDVAADRVGDADGERVVLPAAVRRVHRRQSLHDVQQLMVDATRGAIVDRDDVAAAARGNDVGAASTTTGTTNNVDGTPTIGDAAAMSPRSRARSHARSNAVTSFGLSHNAPATSLALPPEVPLTTGSAPTPEFLPRQSAPGLPDAAASPRSRARSHARSAAVDFAPHASNMRFTSQEPNEIIVSPPPSAPLAPEVNAPRSAARRSISASRDRQRGNSRPQRTAADNRSPIASSDTRAHPSDAPPHSHVGREVAASAVRVHVHGSDIDTKGDPQRTAMPMLLSPRAFK